MTKLTLRYNIYICETQMSSTYTKCIGFYAFRGSIFLMCGFVHFLFKLHTRVFSSQVERI
jgi:hypothetical protein